MSFHYFLVFIVVLVGNQLKLYFRDQPEWNFNLELSHGIIYIKYFECPTREDKPNKLKHLFAKEHFVVIRNHTAEAYLVVQENTHNLSFGEKKLQNSMYNVVPIS